MAEGKLNNWIYSPQEEQQQHNYWHCSQNTSAGELYSNQQCCTRLNALPTHPPPLYRKWLNPIMLIQSIGGDSCTPLDVEVVGGWGSSSLLLVAVYKHRSSGDGGKGRAKQQQQLIKHKRLHLLFELWMFNKIAIHRPTNTRRNEGTIRVGCKCTATDPLLNDGGSGCGLVLFTCTCNI